MEHEENTKKKLVDVLSALVAPWIYVLEAKTFGAYVTGIFLEMRTAGVILGTIVFAIRLLALIPLATAFVKPRYDRAFEALMIVLVIDSVIILQSLPLQDVYALLRSIAFLTLISSIGIGILFNLKLTAISAFMLTLYVLSTNLLLLLTVIIILFALIKAKYKVECRRAAILFVMTLAVSVVAIEHFNLTKWSLWLPFVILVLDTLGGNKLSCKYGRNLKNNIRKLFIQFGMISYSVLGGLPPDNVSIDTPVVTTMLVIMVSYTLIYSLLDKEGQSKNPQTHFSNGHL